MSDEQPPEKKKPLYRRLLPTTVAGKAAATTTLVLLLLLIVVWVLRAFGPQSVRLEHAVSVPQMVVEFLLVFLIPVVLYWGIRRWNQVVVGEFPDIDRAWESGIEALRAIGVNPQDYPIFLVLGSSGDETESGLMDALNTDLVIQGVPDTTSVNHALQWYMTSDAIYLFCPGASSLSGLMGRWKSTVKRSGGGRPVKLARSSDSSSTSTGGSNPASDSTSADVASLKIDRAKPVSSAQPGPTQPGPTQPGPAAARTAPSPSAPPQRSAPAAKTSTMPNGNGGNASRPEAQPAYLGTIQHMAVDSAPQENAQRPIRRGSSAFDMPPAQKNPSSAAPPGSIAGLEAPAAPDSPAPKDLLRPAPKYEGTISSFDPAPAAKQTKSPPRTDSPSTPSTSTPSTSTPSTSTPSTSTPSTSTRRPLRRRPLRRRDRRSSRRRSAKRSLHPRRIPFPRTPRRRKRKRDRRLRWLANDRAGSKKSRFRLRWIRRNNCRDCDTSVG